MPKLEKLVESMNGPREEADYKLLLRELDSLKRAVEDQANEILALKKIPVTKQVASSIGEMKKAIAKLEGVIKENGHRPTDLSSVEKLLRAVGRTVEGHMDAVNSIRIPEVPPFPEIPTPRDVDLSPLMATQSELAASQMDIATRLEAIEALLREEEEEEEEEEAPETWHFEIVRHGAAGQGLIKSIEAKRTV